MKDFLTFRRMVVPAVVKIFFWVGVAACLIIGIAVMIMGKWFPQPSQAILGGLLIILFGPLMVRLACEGIIIIFRIHDTLTEIKPLMAKDKAAPPSPPSSQAPPSGPAPAAGPFCPQCGQGNDPDAKFCTGCGQKLTGS